MTIINTNGNSGLTNQVKSADDANGAHQAIDNGVDDIPKKTAATQLFSLSDRCIIGKSITCCEFSIIS